MKSGAVRHWSLCFCHYPTRPTKCYSYKACKSWLPKATYQVRCKPRGGTFVLHYVSRLLFTPKTSCIEYYEKTLLSACAKGTPFQLNNHRAEVLQIPALHKQEVAIANINFPFSCSLWGKRKKSWYFSFTKAPDLRCSAGLVTCPFTVYSLMGNTDVGYGSRR